MVTIIYFWEDYTCIYFLRWCMRTGIGNLVIFRCGWYLWTRCRNARQPLRIRGVLHLKFWCSHLICGPLRITGVAWKGIYTPLLFRSTEYINWLFTIGIIVDLCRKLWNAFEYVSDCVRLLGFVLLKNWLPLRFPRIFCYTYTCDIPGQFTFNTLQIA